ncbi:hypothetical protein Gpo141_00002127 [Globisporangium polare]
MASTENSMSAALVLEKTTSDPRYTRGQTLLKEKRLEEAVVAYEDLLRTMIETENQSDSLAVAPVYYQYGHSMLLLAEATASVFGGSVAKPEEGGDEDAEQDARVLADDLEIAWEMLEVARVIYSRYPDELAVEKELARVYMRLGDLGMESDVFEQAKSDYEKSLMLRQKILKETKEPDTTLLADLYCCLAISCIYQDSTTQQQVEDAAEGTSVDHSARQEEIRKHEDEGLKYYVLAGRVMAENIHRVAGSCAKELQDFVELRIPKYSANGNDSPVASASKGKGKQKATAEKQELLFTGGSSMDAMKDELLTCVQVFKALKTSDEVEGSLTKDEAQLLEYMEIYGELKEKVDGTTESITSTTAAVKEEETK